MKNKLEKPDCGESYVKKHWYTTGEAAEMINVSQSWIIGMIQEGKIPFVWFGGRRKIKSEIVEELRTNGSK